MEKPFLQSTDPAGTLEKLKELEAAAKAKQQEDVKPTNRAQRRLYEKQRKAALKAKRLYFCDPYKNDPCNQLSCHDMGRGPCMFTTHKEYAKEGSKAYTQAEARKIQKERSGE